MHTDAQEREEFLKVDELAAEWRQHPATIYRKVAAGEIPSVRLGGESAALRIPRSELAKIYEASAVGHGQHRAESGGGSMTAPSRAGVYLPSRPQTPAAHVRAPDPAGGRSRGAARRGQVMNAQTAVWAAQELTARRALAVALEAERRRQRSPRLARCRNLNVIFSYQLAKEEHDVNRP